jgi:hypothetical protein
VHRHPERGGLRVQQGTANAVDAHAVVAGGDGGEQAGDPDARIGAEARQGQRAVLAAAPAQDDRFGTGHGIGRDAGRAVDRRRESVSLTGCCYTEIQSADFLEGAPHEA